MLAIGQSNYNQHFCASKSNTVNAFVEKAVEAIPAKARKQTQNRVNNIAQSNDLYLRVRGAISELGNKIFIAPVEKFIARNNKGTTKI